MPPLADRGGGLNPLSSSAPLKKGEDMKRLLLLAAVCMLGVLVFAPAALAQSAGAEQTPDTPCPTDIDEFPMGTQCGEGGGYVLPDGSVVQPTLTPGASDEPCDGGPTRETPDGTQCINLPDVEFGPKATPTSTPTASPTASPSATPTATAAQYQYTSVLPGTGGVVSPVGLLAIIPAILLLGGGLLSARLIRRS